MNKSSLALWVVLVIVGFTLIGNDTELASGKERPLVVGPFPVRLNPRASQKDRVWTSSSVGLSARRLIARRPQDMVSTAFWSTRSARRCGSPPRRRRTRRIVCAIRAADLAPDAFMLDVRVKKGELKTLRFAIDVEGKGVLDDAVEYDVKTNGVIVKPRTPALQGDIPVEFSPRNVPLTKSHMKIVHEADGVHWRVTAAMSDLYPFIFASGRSVRFALLLNDEQVWGDGYGAIKKPALFGMLRPSCGGRRLVTLADLKTPFGDAHVTAGETIRVLATSGERGAGVSTSVSVVPGSLLRATGRLRGKGCVEPSVWAHEGKRLIGRVNGKRIAFTNEMKPFTVNWELPTGTTKVNVVLFSWRNVDANFEVADFSLVNE